MVAYFKTQWFRIVVACICLGLTIFYLVQSMSIDINSVESLEEFVTNTFTSLGWFCASLTWFIMSVIDWNSDNIQKLNDRLETLERKQESNNDI